MLGSSIAAQWATQRPSDELVVLGRADLDLRDHLSTTRLVADVAPDAIIHAAAVVGGIAAKIAQPTRYLLDNLVIDSSVISAAIAAGVPELLYIGSAAVYPEHFRQPFLEVDMLAAPLEPANEGYAIAKIAGSRLCQYVSAEYGFDYRVAVPSNLYGPGDDFSESDGHLIAAALGKTHAAHISGKPSLPIWGDGTARREFTYSVDLSAWLVGQIGHLSAWPAMLNLGAGTDRSVADYYRVARDVVGYEGDFDYDTSKPSGMHQRLLDSSAARSLGWSPPTSIEIGMAAVYRSYLASLKGIATA
jgi:GDP-L-fucose synthase